MPLAVTGEASVYVGLGAGHVGTTCFLFFFQARTEWNSTMEYSIQPPHTTGQSVIITR